MPRLFYWQPDNYSRDLDAGAGFNLNQDSQHMANIPIGDSLWAFTGRKLGTEHWHYAVAAELVVLAKTENPEGFRYGRYRVWGDQKASRYFAVDDAPDVTDLIRGLSIKPKGAPLSLSFQGRGAVKPITDDDDEKLRTFARALALEPRARLVNEERLEALTDEGDADGIKRLLSEEANGLSEKRRRYLATPAVRRDRTLAQELRNLYGGKCQICAWGPTSEFDRTICEAHHVRWLSRGGLDVRSNLVLLCPNHHSVVHQNDAPFDYRRQCFVLGGRQVLVLENARHNIEDVVE
jgi:5-methylcytosine-specific restriction protein A